VESIGVLIAVNPIITIIAIAAATPPRIPNFLLDEKLNVKLFFTSGLLRVCFGCNLILVSGVCVIMTCQVVGFLGAL